MMKRLLGYSAVLLLVACGNPLQGTWTSDQVPVAAGELTFNAEVDTIFSGSTVTANIALTDSKVTVKATGTYASTENQLTLNWTELTGTDSDGAAVTSRETGTGADAKLCMTLIAATEACVVKSQTRPYTITDNKTLKTTLQLETLTFDLMLTKKD
jgi:hypothetical protein